MTYLGNQHGSFSMLNGIVIKISDKFSSPRKVFLPLEWSSTKAEHVLKAENLLSYKYDFTKERFSICQAKEERLMKEHQLNIKKEREILESEFNERDYKINQKNDVTEKNESLEQILVPQVLSFKHAAPVNITKKIDFHEFESENINPFELVELQTLNEKDELQRVLDPKSVKPKKHLPATEKDDFNLNIFSENNSSIDKNENLHTNIHLTPFSNTPSSNTHPIQSSVLLWKNAEHPTSSNNHYSLVQNNLLTYTSANTLPFGEISMSLEEGKNSRLRHQSFGDAQASLVQEHIVSHPETCEIHSLESPLKLTRTKSLPNLNNSINDESVPDLRINDKEDSFYNKSFENIITSSVDTNRINNIMQQYQFQRMSQVPQSCHNQPYVHNQPQSHGLNQPQTHGLNQQQQHGLNQPQPHGLNQPQQLSSVGIKLDYSSNFSDTNPFRNENLYNNSNSHYTKSNHEGFVEFPEVCSANYNPLLYSNDYISTSTLGNYSSKGFPIFQDAKIPAQSLYCSQQKSNSIPNIIRLPSISTDTPCLVNQVQKSSSDQRIRSHYPILPQISQKQEAIQSWLIDETPLLTTSEKNFAIQISAMGFPLPCVSRSIRRLGVDEKEVLDFMCLYEKTKESGYDPESVEMGLVYCANKMEKLFEYLVLVENFKKLGFQPRDIHNAVLEFSFDQDKVLDYLTK